MPETRANVDRVEMRSYEATYFERTKITYILNGGFPLTNELRFPFDVRLNSVRVDANYGDQFDVHFDQVDARTIELRYNIPALSQHSYNVFAYDLKLDYTPVNVDDQVYGLPINSLLDCSAANVTVTPAMASVGYDGQVNF